MSEEEAGKNGRQRVRFYSDFVSPYSWIALMQAGLELEGPPAHPFRSLEALRTACLFRTGERSVDLCAGLANAAWGEGKDLTDLRVLEECVPAFIFQGEMFWGQDRMSHLADRIQGRVGDPGPRAEELLGRLRGADRPRSPRKKD